MVAPRCLTWGRQKGNNKILEFFGTTFEAYENATDTLMGRLRSVLPEGSTRCRIRANARESREPQQGTLMDTLGDETLGYVMLDPSCISPMRYDQLEILNGIVGKSSVRLSVEEALANKHWRKVDKSIEGLDEKWREDFTKGLNLLKHTWVKATDPHVDAKVFPHLHPYGTGSLLSEFGSGGKNGIPRLCRNRLLLIQSDFRDNAMWAFYNLQRSITSQLFHVEAAKRKQERKSTVKPDEKDAFSRLFGTVMPSRELSTSAYKNI